MRRAIRDVAIAAVAVAAVGVVAGVDRPAAGRAQQPSSTALPVTDAALVCPDVSGTADAPTTATAANVGARVPGHPRTSPHLTATPMTGPRAKPTTLSGGAVGRVTSSGDAQALLVSASGPGADAVVADQSQLIPGGNFRAMVSAPCLAPATDWWIAGADGRVGYADRLTLANSGSTLANVTVTAWSEKGRIDPPNLQSVTVNPNSSSVLPVSQFVPDAATVTLHVHANSGRVVAEVLDRRISGITPTGSDWIAPTQPPARDLVIPGYLGGRGARRLVLTDPGDQDATVSLRLATTGGNFAPAGHQTVVVRAGRSVLVDFTSSLAGVPGAVVLHSDNDIVATGMSSVAPATSRDFADMQWQPAGLAVSGPAAIANNRPPFNRSLQLYLTAPAASGSVRITALDGQSHVVRVPAGRTVVVYPAAGFGTEAGFGTKGYGPLVFTPAGGGPVYVSRTVLAIGAHGPLVTSEQPAPLLAAVTLPAVVPDLRAAVPN